MHSRNWSNRNCQFTLVNSNTSVVPNIFRGSSLVGTWGWFKSSSTSKCICYCAHVDTTNSLLPALIDNWESLFTFYIFLFYFIFLYLRKHWHSTLRDLPPKSRPSKDYSGNLHLPFLIGVCNKPIEQHLRHVQSHNLKNRNFGKK